MMLALSRAFLLPTSKSSTSRNMHVNSHLYQPVTQAVTKVSETEVCRVQWCLKTSCLQGEGGTIIEGVPHIFWRPNQVEKLAVEVTNRVLLVQ